MHPKLRLVKRPFRFRSKQCEGPFPNYVDKILALIDNLPPCVDIFYSINVEKKVDNFGPPKYLPRLVNVVCERPQMSNLLGLHFQKAVKTPSDTRANKMIRIR